MKWRVSWQVEGGTTWRLHKPLTQIQATRKARALMRRRKGASIAPSESHVKAIILTPVPPNHLQ